MPEINVFSVHFHMMLCKLLENIWMRASLSLHIHNFFCFVSCTSSVESTWTKSRARKWGIFYNINFRNNKVDIFFRTEYLGITPDLFNVFVRRCCTWWGKSMCVRNITKYVQILPLLCVLEKKRMRRGWKGNRKNILKILHVLCTNKTYTARCSVPLVLFLRSPKIGNSAFAQKKTTAFQYGNESKHKSKMIN